MPIYEYRCRDCGKYTQLFVRSFSSPIEAICSKCGGANLNKLISRVAVLKSEESRLEDLADPSSLAGLDENDPKSVARWARKMGASMGEDLGPEFDEMVDRMEAGEMPDDLDPEGGAGGDGGEEE